MFKASDYTVVETYLKNDILDSVTLQIKGAYFRIVRLFTNNGVPSRVFKFTNVSDINKDGNLITIGWDTCSAGLMKIGSELGLHLVDNRSIFCDGESYPYFIEEATL